MHRIFLALACLACAGHGRLVQTSSDSHQSQRALASLLQAANPAGAFNPSTSGVDAGLRRMNLKRLQAARKLPRFFIPAMQEKQKPNLITPAAPDLKPGEVRQVPIEIRWSIGNLVTVTGTIFFLYSIGTYLLDQGEDNLIATLGFVYAIPALVGGLGLKYAELPPVPFQSSPNAERLRALKATEIQKSIISDLTRYIYADPHMFEQLKILKLAPAGEQVPKVTNLIEDVHEDGEYKLIIRLEAPVTPWRIWKDRSPRFAKFFGPGVRAAISKYNVTSREVEVELITCPPGTDDYPQEKLANGTYIPVVTSENEADTQDMLKRMSGQEEALEEARARARKAGR